MDELHIRNLLLPFVDTEALTPRNLEQLSSYLALLLKWNAKISLTAVRQPEEIVSRHFGESLFAAKLLLPNARTASVIDLGSGAGFPGLPFAIYAPDASVTLIESQNKKATFLKEVARTLELKNVKVFAGRGEDLKQTADLVTMRAVEKFEQAAATAAGLVSHTGRLALLIGEAQTSRARQLLPAIEWTEPVAIPNSAARVVLVGNRS